MYVYNYDSTSIFGKSSFFHIIIIKWSKNETKWQDLLDSPSVLLQKGYFKSLIKLSKVKF